MRTIGIAKGFVLQRFGAFSVNHREMRTVGIPALLEAGAARLGTWEIIVFHWFYNVSWSAPGDFLGGRRRPRVEAAAECGR